MSAAPSVSVVVPTYNRSDRLAGLIAALSAQDLESPFEVVVVDDSSTDSTPDELCRLQDTFPFVRAVRLRPNRGPAAARNEGWRAAAAPLIAFTDDDCKPRPGWLRGIVAGLDRADLVQGQTVPDPIMRRHHGPFGHTLERRAETGFYETCNMGYRRSVLEKMDGFDERFRHPFGEDLDLAWRAKDAGCTTTFAADAVVVHEVRTSDFVRYIRGLTRLEGLVRAVSLHPVMRAGLHRGTFYNAAHPRALAVAAAGILLLARPRSRTRWLATAATLAWWSRAAMRVRQYPCVRKDWAWVLPLAGVADMAELAVLLRASLRHRTLVL